MLGIKIRFEHIVILFLLGVIFFLVNCNGSDCDTETSTEVTEKIITQKDSTTNNNIKNRKPGTVKIIESPEKVRIIPDPEKLPEEEKSQVKTANRYIDTTRISEGYVISNILSEGRILKLDLKTSIDHLQRTITTTKTIIRKPVGIYWSPGLAYSPIAGVSDISCGITFLKGNFGATISGYYNLRPFQAQLQIPQDQFGIQLQFHIKL